MAEACQECGKDESDGVYVGAAGHYGPICNECWATFLRQETVLSEREAEVAALKDLDLTHREIADRLDIKKSTVDTYVSRIMEKVQRAHRTVDELAHFEPDVEEQLAER